MRESNQTESIDADLAREAIYLRGLLINRFSAIEHAISEVVFRAYGHQLYSPLGKPSFQVAKRKRQLENLMLVDGPISQYKTQIEPILKDIGDLEEYRRFVAHAIMVPNGRTKIIFRMLHVVDGSPVEGAMDTNVLEMNTLSDRVGVLSRTFCELVARMCREIPLPSV